jgi:undecaprenyl-diphosphatase
MRWNPAPPAVSARRALPRTTSELVLLLPGIAGFAALAFLVRARRTEAADLAISLRIQALKHPAIERAMAVVSWVGFPPQSRLIPPGVAAALWLGRARLEAIMLLGAWGSALLSTIVKTFMRRPRPVAGTDLRVVAARLGGSSFPSGHVLTYTAVYGWLAVVADVLIRPDRLRRLVVAGLAALVAGVGPSRIHLGHHWPTDVTASYLLGSSYLAALVVIYRRLKARPMSG